MKLKVTTPSVSVNWLNENLAAENLVVLDATIPKVGTLNKKFIEKKQIKGARFFDIKKIFSDVDSIYPNTILSPEVFQQNARELGIYKDSCIVVYDDHGVYSSPRVWWLFKAFGFINITVLDGGLPEWIKNDFFVENPSNKQYKQGDFLVKYQPNKVSFTEDVLVAIKQDVCIADARSKVRFYAEELEPREDVRSGHIPNSVNIPYTVLQKEGKMKSEAELSVVFSEINPKKNPFIFTCGSGITACILALGLEIIGNTNYSVYDGSWSEWGSRHELPIETR